MCLRSHFAKVRNSVNWHTEEKFCAQKLAEQSEQSYKLELCALDKSKQTNEQTNVIVLLYKIDLIQYQANTHLLPHTHNVCSIDL